MATLDFHERQHVQMILLQENSIKSIFDEFARNTSQELASWKNSNDNHIWRKNSAAGKRINNHLQALHDKLLDNITKYSKDAWKRSHQKNDDLITTYIKGLPVNDVVKNGMFVRNEQALTAFLERKIEGLTISENVWKITEIAQNNLDFYVSSGLASGRSANLISQDIRQLLKDPNRRFRRIKNEQGKLVASEPMKAYHPGRGVYRSSYKNALRFSATNTNEMYRTTDFNRWQKLDFILGIDIRRSKHNKGPCPICDPLVGRYPKDFLFKGWHPFCICVATPILMDQQEFIEGLTTGNWPNHKNIRTIPSRAKTYFHKQIKAGKLELDGYLLKENKEFI